MLFVISCTDLQFGTIYQIIDAAHKKNSKEEETVP